MNNWIHERLAPGVRLSDEADRVEMFAHVPLFAHGDARDVLIIGGGDCGLAEEGLKRGTVRRLVQVEWDASVVDAVRRHLGTIDTLPAGAPSSEPLHERVRCSGSDFRHYTAEVHKAAFVLPAYIKELREGRQLAG